MPVMLLEVFDEEVEALTLTLEFEDSITEFEFRSPPIRIDRLFPLTFVT
jgi:hypothetical protein